MSKKLNVAIADWDFGKSEFKNPDSEIKKDEMSENQNVRNLEKENIEEIPKKLVIETKNNINNKISESQEVGITEAQKPEKSELNNLTKEESQKVRKSGKNQDVFLRPKTFDLPPEIIKQIKIYSAVTGKKEYEIAIEAFTLYFKINSEYQEAEK